jgi:uncharacterized protein (DUF58 family)
MRSTAERTEAGSAEPQAGRFRLTTEGLVWAGVSGVLGVLGWYKSLNLVLVLAYAMIALLILNGFLARLQVRRVAAARVSIPPVLAGEDTRVVVLVRNTRGRPATVGVSDPIGPPGGWFLERIWPGEAIECSMRRSFATRGRFGNDPPTVWSGFPFGLIRYERQAVPPPRDDGPPAPLVVLPSAGTAEAEGLRRWVLRQAGGEGRAQKVLRRATTDPADVRGVRPYRPGDSIRWVHWRSSARRRQLLVREYDAAPSPELVVVVEPWLSGREDPGERANLEAALSLAVTVTLTWARAFGTRVTLALATSEPVVRSASGAEDSIREALVPLADVSGTGSPAAPGARAFSRSLAGAARVFVSSRPGSPLAEALIRSTGRPFVVLDPTARLLWYQPPPGRNN